MELGIEYAKKNNADLLLATDPDCDRVGIAVKNTQGEYVLLSGNETGMLLLDYICSRRTQMKTMPEDPVTVKTIVTIDMAERIAAKYGVKTINVLTGFKFIGEQIGFLEKQGKEDSYIFGMEESYGYLSGSYVRDKDGVNAAFLICEMFTYYASQGIGLFEKLNELYAEYGYCLILIHLKVLLVSKKCRILWYLSVNPLQNSQGKKFLNALIIVRELTDFRNQMFLNSF
jgi:phosphoglucomutase